MWEVSVADQTVTFGIALLLGAGYCVFYDLVRAARLESRFGAVAVCVQDLFFWLACGLSTFCFLLARCNGVVRSYVLLGLLVGFALFRLLLSPLLLLRPVFRLVARLRRLFCALCARFYRLLTRLAASFSRLARRARKKLAKVVKKRLKPGADMVYNQAESETRTKKKDGSRRWRKRENRKKA